MTLRLPEETDTRLDELAKSRHTSKHALLIEAARHFLDREEEQVQADEAIDHLFSHHGEAVERLADL